MDRIIDTKCTFNRIFFDKPLHYLSICEGRVKYRFFVVILLGMYTAMVLQANVNHILKYPHSCNFLYFVKVVCVGALLLKLNNVFSFTEI